jgi:hypothetical protein
MSNNKSTFFVSAENLNFRKTPESNGDIITKLHHGTRVIVDGEFKENSYVKSLVTLEGKEREGYIYSRYLRESESPKIEKLIHQVTKEWRFFKRGLGKESEDNFSDHIGEMWSSLGRKKDNGETPTGKDIGWWWSAAFISWVLKNADYNNTKFSSAHSVYINEAIRNRLTKNTNADFWCYRLNEQKPKVGDIVCNWRGKEERDGIPRPITYGYAEENQWFPSHTDIVIAVRDHEIITIGGNVSDSVETKRYLLDENGFLVGNASNKLFAIMKNQHR